MQFTSKISTKWKIILYFEFVVSFLLLPYLLMLTKNRAVIYLTLTVLSVVCVIILKKYYAYNFVKDWNSKAINKALLKQLFPRVFFICIILFLFTFFVVPEKLFSFPMERPSTWAFIMLWYPIFSVLPQEFLYRSYFYHRFKDVFSHKTLWIVSALLFAWAHIVLQNVVAVSFCIIGGLCFAKTYEKTKSLAAAVLEHSIYGCWLFTLGLGVFFYHGLAVK